MTEDDDMHNVVTHDTRQSGTGNVRISLVGMDKPFFTALALALSVFAVIYSFEAGRQLNQYVYWEQRTSTFLEQLSSQGIPVPKDILDHIRKEHPK